MSVAAGWYADPVSPSTVWWWNGTEWTSTVAAAPAPQPTGPPPYVAVEHRIAPVDPEAWSPINVLVPRARSFGVRALVWGIVAVLLPVALLPAVMAIVFGAGGLDRARALNRAGQPATGRGPALAGLLLGIASVVLLVVLVVAWSALV